MSEDRERDREREREGAAQGQQGVACEMCIAFFVGVMELHGFTTSTASFM